MVASLVTDSLDDAGRVLLRARLVRRGRAWSPASISRDRGCRRGRFGAHEPSQLILPTRRARSTGCSRPLAATCGWSRSPPSCPVRWWRSRSWSRRAWWSRSATPMRRTPRPAPPSRPGPPRPRTCSTRCRRCTTASPGPVAALLESSAYVELVADGVHVHPSVLALAWRPGRTALVTDAMAAAGRGRRRVPARIAHRRGPGRRGAAACDGRDRRVDRDPGLLAAVRRPPMAGRTAARSAGRGHLDPGRDARPAGRGPASRRARAPTWSSCPTSSR